MIFTARSFLLVISGLKAGDRPVLPDETVCQMKYFELLQNLSHMNWFEMKNQLQAQWIQRKSARNCLFFLQQLWCMG